LVFLVSVKNQNELTI